MKCRIEVKQDYNGETVVGFLSEECEIVERGKAHHFTLEEASAIIPTLDYDLCRLLYVSIQRVTIEVELIDIALGEAMRFTYLGKEAERTEALQRISTALGLPKDTVPEIWDKSGRDVAIDFINDQIARF